MPLFMLIHKIDGKDSVLIVEANTKLYASLAAGMAGFGGTPVSAHDFEPAQARKISKKMIGRVLTQGEMEALLKGLGQGR